MNESIKKKAISIVYTDFTLTVYLNIAAGSLTGLSFEITFVSERVVISFGFLFNEVLNAAPQHVKTLRCFQPVFVVFITEACVRLCAAAAAHDR